MHSRHGFDEREIKLPNHQPIVYVVEIYITLYLWTEKYLDAMNRGYVAFGSAMLVIAALMIITITNLVPNFNTSLNQVGSRITSTSPQQFNQLMLLGQKLTPIFALGGSVCLGYGIRAKR